MPNIDWSKLISLKYWLEGLSGTDSLVSPISMDSPFFWIFIYTFSIVSVIGFLLMLFNIYMHPQNPLQPKISIWANSLATLGILGLSWFAMREIRIGILSSRFWLLFGAFWVFGLLVYSIRYYFTFYKLEMLYFKEKVLKNKK